MRNIENQSQYEEEEYLSSEDRQIRLAVRNPRYRDWDYDYNWDYSPYHYGYTYGYYYNPYYFPYPVYSGITIRDPKNTTIRTTPLASYTPQTVTVRDPKTGKVTTVNPNAYQQSNTKGSTRTIIRNTSDNSDRGNSRTYNPGSSSSGSSTPKSGSAPVSRPPRP